MTSAAATRAQMTTTGSAHMSTSQWK
jgi:hypothetical protein